jgi:hypothetical protein
MMAMMIQGYCLCREPAPDAQQHCKELATWPPSRIMHGAHTPASRFCLLCGCQPCTCCTNVENCGVPEQAAAAGMRVTSCSLTYYTRIMSSLSTEGQQRP